MAVSNTTRRGFMAGTAALAASAGMAGNLHAAPDRPNILLIICDDLGDGDMGAYGHPSIRTPNLDRLASGGMLFTNAFSTISSCSPSRAAIFTGKYPHATGAEDLHIPLPAGETVFPAILGENGYHTMYAGKLHLGGDAKAQFDDAVVLGDSHMPSRDLVDTNDRTWRAMLDRRPADRPFFMGIGFSDPHRPYEEGVVGDPADPADVVVPPYLADAPATRAELALYYDYVLRMDRNVGQILDTLDEEGLAESTVVLFMSDNGIPFPRAKRPVTTAASVFHS